MLGINLICGPGLLVAGVLRACRCHVIDAGFDKLMRNISVYKKDGFGLH